MATLIPWTDETWNPLVGCSKISIGCKECYAAEAAKSARLQQFPQYQKVKEWNGTIEFVENQLVKPLSWRSPKKVFVCSMSDIFHKNVKDEWLDKIFAVMALAKQHTFQVLTKRPERIRPYLQQGAKQRIRRGAVDLGRELKLAQKRYEAYETCDFDWPLPNVWLGTSVENQQAAVDRIPLLLDAPVAVRFLSCEPLLEELNLVSHERQNGIYNYLLNTWEPRISGAGGAVAGGRISPFTDKSINQVIIGGESGSSARPCHIEWIRSLVRQCQQTKTAVFVKQWGSQAINSTPYIDGVVQTHFQVKLKNPKGGDITELPLDIQIREFPRFLGK
jgi:protein gp37